MDESKVPKLIDEVPANTPLTLEYLCINCLTKNPSILFKKNTVLNSQLQFHQEVFLPPILTDTIFSYFLSHSSLTVEEVVLAFSDPLHCCLQRCQLSNVALTACTLCKLCLHQNIQVLELFNVTFSGSNCCMKKLFKLCGSKLTLVQFHNVKYLSEDFQYLKKDNLPGLKFLKLTGELYAWYFIMDGEAPAPLVSLELNNVKDVQTTNSRLDFLKQEAQFKENIYNQASFYLNLNHLEGDNNHKAKDDMSDWSEIDKLAAGKKIKRKAEEKLSSGYFLSRYRLNSLKNTLLSLILYDTQFDENDLNAIFQLKKLLHLDISCSAPRDDPLYLNRPTTYSVWNIVEELPELISLDVSNTEIGDKLFFDGKLKDITGERRLSESVVRKLSFLGLSESEGCEVVDIYALAHQVSGYHNEHQIMTSLQRYRNRPKMLKVSFSHLYAINRQQLLSCPHKVLKLLVDTVHRHPTCDGVAVSCTANFFFLVRQQYHCFIRQERHDIMMSLIKYMQKLNDKKQIIRNCILTLFHFDFPSDFIFEFDKIIKTLLQTLMLHLHTADVNTLSINMCNAIACSIDYDKKFEVAEYGFVETMLKVISHRVMMKQSGELLQAAWSALWNITDETPLNSEVFIQNDGLELLEECFDLFKDVEVHKNMMGLVGNIAEVKHLRTYLMNSKLVSLFYNLLIQENQNLEIAYNVSGTLSHLMSDGPEAWTCLNPSMDDVRRSMYQVITTWDIHSSRSINYRSFLPILKLIPCDVPECVHWAVWALCNLSNLDDKYGELLALENGIGYLSSIESRPLMEETKNLARELIKKIRKLMAASSHSIAD